MGLLSDQLRARGALGPPQMAMRPPQPAPAAASNSSDDADDDELECIGLLNANGGLPHSRSDCAQFAFSSTPHSKFCDKCELFAFFHHSIESGKVLASR